MEQTNAVVVKKAIQYDFRYNVTLIKPQNNDEQNNNSFLYQSFFSYNSHGASPCKTVKPR